MSKASDYIMQQYRTLRKKEDALYEEVARLEGVLKEFENTKRMLESTHNQITKLNKEKVELEEMLEELNVEYWNTD